MASPRFRTGGGRMLWGGSSAATNGITSASQTVDVSLLARASTSLGSVKTAAPSAEQHFGDRSRALLGVMLPRRYRARPLAQVGFAG